MRFLFLIIISLLVTSVVLNEAAQRQELRTNIYVAPWTTEPVRKPLSFGAGLYATHEYYTQDTYVLKLTCSFILPCDRRSYIKIFNAGGVVVGWYCSVSLDSFVSMPDLSAVNGMKLEIYAGWSLTADYKCQVQSVPGECPCGKSGGGRIVGGVAVARGAIPWQVGLGSRQGSLFSIFCGGALISSRHVITAAHCIKNSDISVKVFMGDVDLWSTIAVVAGLARIQQHESYNAPTRYNNDIAVLTLDRSITFNGNLYPVCLPRKFASDTFKDRDLLVSGWGRLTESNTNLPTWLQSVTVRGISNFQCSQAYTSITSSMLCAANAGKDSCQGDSGGPLTYTQSSVTYLVGVVSFGTGCARPGFPGVYTRVTSHLNWIDSKTGSPLCSK